jgi:hypothetical protein
MNASTQGTVSRRVRGPYLPSAVKFLTVILMVADHPAVKTASRVLK